MTTQAREGSLRAPVAAGGAVLGAGWIERHALALVLLLFAANVALKAPLVEAQGIWFDEAVTMQNGHRPFALGASLAADATPPLYALAVQGWLALFGTSLEAARALSVLLSSLTALLLFRLGRRFVDPATGLLAALLFTTSRYQLHYGHEARPYALVGLLCVASFHALLALLERPGRARVLALAALDAALLYTHYVAVLLFPVQLAVAALRGPARRRNVLAVATGEALACAAFVPLLLYLLSAWPPPMSGWLAVPGWREAKDLLTGFAGSAGLLAIDALLLGGGLVAVALSARARRSEVDWSMATAFATWAFLPLALAFAASQLVPVFLDRYLLFASPGLYLLLAWTVVRLPLVAPVRLLLAAALCILSLATAQRDPIVRPDWRGAAERVRSETARGALALVVPAHQLLPLAYHLTPAFGDTGRMVERLRAAGVVGVASPADVLAVRPRGDSLLLLVLTEATADAHPELVAGLVRRGFVLAGSERLPGIVLLRLAPTAR